MPAARRPKLPTASAKQQLAAKVKWNEARSAEGAGFFTFGYSGRKPEELFKELKRQGVKTVLDIRRNPVSVHRPEMSIGKLAPALKRRGIAYSHAPELGVPNEVRAKAADAGGRDAIWAWYDKDVLAGGRDLRAIFKGLEQPVALMCTEIDPHDCHRHRLALALEGEGLTSYDL